MSRPEQLVRGLGGFVAATLLNACSSLEGMEFDGGFEPTQVDGAQIGRDAEPRPREDASGPPPPASTLDSLLDASSGAVHARVLLVRREAVVGEVRAAGANWRIYQDLVDVEASRSIGAGRLGTMTVSLIPTRCEAFDDEGQPIPDLVLSHCTGRNEHNSPLEGETMIALLSGNSETPMLTFRMTVSASGEVDASALAEPPEDTQVDRLWEALEARWRALGRR